MSKMNLLVRSLDRRGIKVAEVKILGEDGTLWTITEVDAGRARRPDGSFGFVEGSLGGFRLFDESGEEHDAVEDDLWQLGDLLDYVKAVTYPSSKGGAQ